MNLRKRFFLGVIVIMIMAYGSSALAAGLSGIVRDNETGEPIQYASVRITELNTGTLTDEHGRYGFTDIPDGVYTIRVSLTGYSSVSQKTVVPGGSPVNILMSISPYVMEETVSTARGRETLRADIPGSVGVVTEDELRESNPVSLSETLAREPGIAVNAEMPWGSRTVIRGMSKDQIVMLVDGARVVTATAVPAQFGTVATSDIERVEVLKGPLSVLYGSGSTGGVVNVITRKGQFTTEPNVGFSLNPAYESAANGLSSYERASYSNSGFYVSLSQSNRKYSDYRTADNERIRNSQFQDRQTQVNFGIRLSDRHTFEGRYQDFSVIDVGIPGGASFPPKAIASYPTTGRRLFDAAWTWRPSAQWVDESRLNVYYQPVDRNAHILPNAPSSLQDHPQDATKQLRLTPMEIGTDARHDVYGFRWQNVMELGSHSLVAGFEGWQKDMESDRYREIRREIVNKDTGEAIGNPVMMTVKDNPVPDSSQRPVGVFAEDTFPWGERLKVTLGGRFDQIHTENDISYMTFEPKSDVVLWEAFDDDDVSWSMVAGAVYNATESVDLNLTLARSFRSPTIEERYLYADLGGVLTVGDPEIDPEKGAFVEGGITARVGSAKLNAQAFFNDITDMVIKKPGGDLKGRPVDYQYANAGEARLRGMEAEALWAVTPRLLLSADISYIRGTDENTGDDLPSMPPLTGHVSGRLNAGKGFWFELLVTLINRQDNVAPGEEETPGYGLLTVTAGKSLLRTGTVSHDLVLGVRNVLDKQYRDHLTVSRGYEMYGMGRSVFASWRITGE